MPSRFFADAVRVRSGIAGLIVAGAALFPGGASGQYPNPGPPTQPETPVPGTSSNRPRFSVDATVEPGAGAPRVRLDYRLARSELLFERRPTGYHAAYEVRAIFYRDKDDRQVTGDVFVRELNVKTYAETRPIGGDIIDHIELSAPPGKYDVVVVIRDLVAERSSGTKLQLEIPAQAAGPLWFSDLSFGTVTRPVDPSNPREALELVPSRSYSDDIGILAVFGDVIDNRPPAQETYKIEYRVLNDLQERKFLRDTTIARREGRTPFLLRPGILSLAPGSYRFVVELKAPVIPAPGGKRNVPIRREKTFEVVQSVASITADPKTTLDQLRYIAEESERGEMDAVKTDEQRREFYDRFWARRDPEQRKEFYRRVNYANQHFSVAGAGWKTDMGQIYIKYGQPDEVVRSPFNFDRPPEEVWYYYRERRTFTFVDEKGFGRYDLDRNRSQ